MRFHATIKMETRSDGYGKPSGSGPKPIALSEEETSRLLAELPVPRDGEEDLGAGFRMPEPTLEPPETGLVEKAAFPLPDEKTAPVKDQVDPLEILRYYPTGAAGLETSISIEFSQAMVPLSSLEEIRATDIPVTITPAVKGKWTWKGPRLLDFTADPRFPMATEYRVTIPAGTKSALGAELAEPVEWVFSTELPTVLRFYPNQITSSRDPVILLRFNQAIDPETVFPSITASSDRRNNLPLQLLGRPSIDEISGKDKKLVSRWMKLKLERQEADAPPLGWSEQVRFLVHAGVRSEEGPLASDATEEFSFTSCDRFRVLQQGTLEVEAGYDWRIRFSNELAPYSLKKGMVVIEPGPEKASIRTSGADLVIHPEIETAGRSFSVKILPGLRDVFGQRLDDTLHFKVKVAPIPARPALWLETRRLLVVGDPRGPAKVVVFSRDLPEFRIKVFKISRQDWTRTYPFLSDRINELAGLIGKSLDKVPPEFGTPAMDRVISVKGGGQGECYTEVDCSEVLDPLGHAWVWIERPDQEFEEYQAQTTMAWFQRTGLCLEQITTGGSQIAWVTELETGRPVEQAEVRSADGELLGSTGPDGLLEFSDDENPAVFAEKDGDFTLLIDHEDHSPSGFDTIGGWTNSNSDFKWFITDDRSIYQPGEAVHVKGWIREYALPRRIFVPEFGPQERVVWYSVWDRGNNELASAPAHLNEWGGFDFSFEIPEGAQLGTATIRLEWAVRKAAAEHSIDIQEFRRPEFTTEMVLPVEPVVQGEPTEVSIIGRYFDGTGLEGAQVRWKAQRERLGVRVSFPYWGQYWFGMKHEWYKDSEPQVFEGVTGSGGWHRLQLTCLDFWKPCPLSLSLEGTITDKNLQEWSSYGSLIVHPASEYVGLRRLSYEEAPGTGAGFEVVVVGLDGQVVAGRMVALRLGRMEYDSRKGRYVEVEQSVLERVLNSGSEPVQTWFDLEEEGYFQISAYILDDKGRESRTEIDFSHYAHLDGPDTPRGKRTAISEDVVTEPQAEMDKETYEPGETALLMVQTPVVPVQGLLLVSAGGLVQKEHFVMTEHAQALQIPVREAFIPVMTVHVFLSGGLQEPLQEPFQFSSFHPVSVSGAGRQLDVTIEPERTVLAPGDTMDVRISVVDASSAPAPGAEITVWMVDESVLALAGRDAEKDPFFFFHSLPYWMTEVDHARRTMSSENMLILDPDRYGSISGLYEGIVDSAGSAYPFAMGYGDHSLLVRQDFNPCALFVGSAKTDAQGVVSLPVQMPDNLTRYRVVAYAAFGDHSFGMQTSAVITKQPLSVIPSAPRFLRIGDRCMLPVLVHNRTDRPARVSVAARGQNLELTGTTGYQLTVPAMDRVEVSFPARPLRPGTAKFSAIVRGEEGADAVEVSIPVYTPATSEAFALYGDMEQGMVSQPVRVPEDVFPEYGGFQFTTASTRMQGLTDAFLYLVRYPYECAEQRASRMLAIAALEPVLRTFDVEGIPDREELMEFLRADIQGLTEIQKKNGGFGFWAGGNWPASPFLSAHVAHALVRVRDQWQLSDSGMLDRVLLYLDSLHSLDNQEGAPLVLSTSARAYALYVAALSGQSVGEQAQALLSEAGIDEINLEAAGWLLTALHRGNVNAEAEISRLIERILNSVEETGTTAHFAVHYHDGEQVFLHSNLRSDAVLLNALLEIGAGERIASKVADGLLAGRRKGYWLNTQENVFCLLALKRYFESAEKEEPDFTARIWLNGRLVQEQAFAGRSVEQQRVTVPMAYLAEQGPDLPVILQNEGVGRLYYRMAMDYAPGNLVVPALERGFRVERTFTGMDDPSDVRQDPDGTWRIKAGARVWVRLALSAAAVRHYVALQSPLPAGLEIIHSSLEGRRSILSDRYSLRWMSGTWAWYGHENLRTDRGEVFADMLYPGNEEYRLPCLATGKGRFIAAPAKAEEMYRPDVFGRTGTDIIVIE